MATPIPQNRAGFTLDEVVRATSGVLSRGTAGARVSSVATDSRAVRSGALFVALRGERFDGHAFLGAARQAGASAALVARGRGREVPEPLAAVEVDDVLRALGDLAAYHRRRWGRSVVAITGSAGKTTTKELAAAALEGAGLRVRRTEGNLNNLVGAPMTIFTLDDDADCAVLELGTSARGEIARLGEIARPDVGVVTLASAAHTQGLGTLADVAAEKSALWRALGREGTVVFNADDEATAPLARSGVAERAMSFGASPSADVRLVGRAADLRMGQRATFEARGRRVEARLALLGEVAALDAAAALAVALAVVGDERLEEAARGLGDVQPTPGRLAPVPGRGGVLLVDDTYNANPRSAVASLHTVAELARLAGTRAVAVLGDMKELGDASRSLHEEVGRAAVVAGLAVFVGCGREMAAATSAAVVEAAARRSVGLASAIGSASPTRVVHVVEPLDAIEVLRGLLSAGDVVLVKGSRSMRMERIVDALREPAGGGEA
jgi:UDP-N-acetylmuramoyl-tripeptide--D-alanyl-D-alanine ligase